MRKLAFRPPLAHSLAEIHRVTVASYPAEYVLHDALDSITTSDPKDFHLHPELKRKVYSALADGDEGELSIVIPPQVHVRQVSIASFASRH